MATEKWIAGSGVGLTWTAAFTASTLDSIVNGNAILSDVQINNASALDTFCDLSIAFGSITWAAPNYVGVYLYPLNQDGSTYGDDRFGTSAAGPPGANYWVGNISCATGAAANEGMIQRIVMPPGAFKFVIYNQTGATLAASGANSAKYRTYNRSVA
jgi:hypothetical protein